ncbi:DNA helicase INO80-like protein [Actinidia rufa]|uniref:Chromatin-remodeling ATPase INO80 n=1 Tax=Actinidia rufa TaxID=165716 RepID=A0A7J0FD65_9ERIC|nr:DNA helicase INO80-like protein [Actinidia rufa]
MSCRFWFDEKGRAIDYIVLGPLVEATEGGKSKGKRTLTKDALLAHISAQRQWLSPASTILPRCLSLSISTLSSLILRGSPHSLFSRVRVGVHPLSFSVYSLAFNFVSPNALSLSSSRFRVSLLRVLLFSTVYLWMPIDSRKARSRTRICSILRPDLCVWVGCFLLVTLGGAMEDRSNGVMSKKELSLAKKKRRNVYSSEDEEESSFGAHITEERYRAMLGEHIQKYKRRLNNSSASPASTRIGMPTVKSSSKGRRSYEIETASDFPNNVGPQKLGNFPEADFAPEHGIARTIYEPAYLDIGDGIAYRIPPTYEKLAASLNLPGMSDIKVDEFYLKGTLDLGSLAAMMANDKKFGPTSQAGMGESRPQYESLQARLMALSDSNSGQKFNLKVSDIGLDSSSIPEGAAGGIRRSILSEGGVLQVYYVKVLEKGDTYEIIERSLPKRQKVKKDPSMIEKEEMDKIGKYWVNIVRKDIPKHHRIFTNFHRKQLADAKRFSETCQREVKMKMVRSLKLMRGAAIRTRKLARDMLVFWKRIDKEMAEVRKREEREAAEALKREQELREAKRQQQRLNFLLSQTELYSHFMQNKSTSQPSEVLPTGDDALNDQEMLLSSVEAQPGEEEDPEEAELKMEALRAAQDAVSKQKKITSTFDTECLKLRQAADLDAIQEDASIVGSSNIDLLHPSTMPIKSSVQTPELFKGSLKEYQLKGLQWLVNCYEQGLNGILADEMGLGKTIQAMAFLAHLAEEKNIWGPFLVVAPASVLNNWADEISRFCPDLKTLPYWGGLQERTVLRKNIIPKRLYRREAGFHILITSYQLLVSDEKYFRRVKWQYMVLDEAQAIKSSNRIEGHAEHGGTLNEHQLNRLHAILKPFMLRRAIKNKISLAELFDRNRGHLSEDKMLNLMNIVIQLRKVCNHPELFERNEGSTCLHFGEIPNSLLPPPFGELDDIYYSGGWNPITYKIPKLVYQDVVRSSVTLCSAVQHGVSRELFEKHFNIFSPENVYRSMLRVGNSSDGCFARSGTFGFAHLIDLSPAEVAFLATGSFMERLLFSIVRWDQQFLDDILNLLMEVDYDDHDCNQLEREKVRAVTRMLLMPSRSQTNLLRRRLGTGPKDAPFEALVMSHQDRLLSNVRFLHSAYSFIPRTRAPPINAHCSDRNFAYQMLEELHHPWAKRLLIGFARTSDCNGPSNPSGPPHPLIEEIDSELPVSQPALQLTYKIFGSCPPMQPFDPAKMLTDYMNYRKYRYLRLDGSSSIMDRRDMVRDFQHRSDIFVFLLSTRAGGLGINLTAADTVIFYESDWNPTLDLQAMDRAHRLGQTKDDDLLAPEDVVSLLIDDAQLAQKLKEIPLQARDRQKRKGGTKRIRIDAEGDASLEDVTNNGSQGNGVEASPDPEKAKSSSKKRKATPREISKSAGSSSPNSRAPSYELDDSLQNTEAQQQKPKRPKRPTKSVNDNLEPAFTAPAMVVPGYTQNPLDR